ncbi:hypothetical protein MUB24_22835 [Lederbergia sp. NSJ-179]|uniref:hypothetical protein n=1 Tax=Lederbergia sp. NSJ-179 TaxID=2931402 RepID=UPI001FD48CA2|nr:hypothetical protein [Lederbergia sp. NSJ-179]MCJ7843649.1 hypothetical protein [Lederbergia sp. NSJ-179]
MLKRLSFTSRIFFLLSSIILLVGMIFNPFGEVFAAESTKDPAVTYLESPESYIDFLESYDIQDAIDLGVDFL